MGMEFLANEDPESIVFLIGILVLVIVFLAISKRLDAEKIESNQALLKEHMERIEVALSAICSSGENGDATDILYIKRHIKAIKELIDRKDTQLREKTKEVDEISALLETRNSEFEKMLESNLTSMPYLAGIMADYLTYDIEVLAKKLDWGADQKREKKVLDIREIRKEARERIEAAKEAEYQLGYLLELYPELQEIIETDYKDLFVYESIERLTDNYDKTRFYLDKEEWKNLDSSERNQLALDRYIESRSKNKWQIGRDYEESVAYNMYEIYGWKTEPTGITQKLEDMGRDIIAKNGDEIDIVQCKYWSKDKTIHEKHIFQLYGTTFCYKLELKDESKTVTPVFVTNIELSSVAHAVAKHLGVRVVENYSMKEYPRIKCNIGKDENGLKTYIYHLPMDQQYDSVVIDERKGELRTMTVEEAESKGFRRAYKWHSKN